MSKKEKYYFMIKTVNEMNYKEKEELLEQIIKDLKRSLSEERFLHCISSGQ